MLAEHNETPFSDFIAATEHDEDELADFNERRFGAHSIQEAHERIRVLSTDVAATKKRLRAVEARVTTIDLRVHEQKEMLSRLHEDITVLKLSSDDVKRLSLQTISVSDRTQELIKQHIHDESEAYAKQSRLISDQLMDATKKYTRLSHLLIAIFSVLSVLIAALSDKSEVLLQFLGLLTNG